MTHCQQPASSASTTQPPRPAFRPCPSLVISRVSSTPSCSACAGFCAMRTAKGWCSRLGPAGVGSENGLLDQVELAGGGSRIETNHGGRQAREGGSRPKQRATGAAIDRDDAWARTVRARRARRVARALSIPPISGGRRWFLILDRAGAICLMPATQAMLPGGQPRMEEL